MILRRYVVAERIRNILRPDKSRLGEIIEPGITDVVHDLG